MTIPSLTKNPGLLKLELMLKGMRVDESLYQKHNLLANYRLGPKCFGNLDIILPGETYVSVPYQEDFAKESPYKLRYLHGKFFLTGPDESIRVQWVTQPNYYSQRINEQASIGDVVSVHGGYVSLAIGGHRYLQQTLFASDGSSTRPELVISVDETIAVLERVRKDRPIDVVSLSCWAPSESDGGISQIEPYIRAIKNSFNVLVFIEVHLPKSTALINSTYAIGADSVCYHIGNLCSHGVGAGSKPSHQETDVALLKHAVEVFPPGSILAHITVGENPFTDTMEDIARLTQIKVLPILTVETLEMAQKLGFDAQMLAPLFASLYDSAKRHRVKMNWFSRLAPFVAPIEGRYFVGDIPRFKLALMNFYQSRFMGGSISASLSNMRRKLRVREIKPRKGPGHD